MRLAPPWHWFSEEWPDDEADCWFVRFGQPEPPIRALWELASLSFIADVGGEPWAVTGLVVLKWRLVTP